MENKIVIYFKPVENENESVKSFTLTFSKIGQNSKTYKQKATLQYWSNARKRIEEYKMKEFHLNSEALIGKINLLDFNANYTKEDEKHSDYIVITYNDKKIETTNLSEIEDFLKAIHFMDIAFITHKHYQYIKDMNDYVVLINKLNLKISTLNGDELKKISKIFYEINPYILFENMDNLSEFIKNYKSN